MADLRSISDNISRILVWGVFVSMTWMILSCEEFCEESNRTAMVANFYDSETGLAKTMQNMTVKGIDNDVLYDGGSLKTLLLPLNPAVDSTGYVIVNDTIAIDTIIIRYTRHPGFISSECGCVTYSNITDDIGKTNHSIKEITITNRGVTTVSYRENVVNAENIGIYY